MQFGYFTLSDNRYPGNTRSAVHGSLNPFRHSRAVNRSC